MKELKELYNRLLKKAKTQEKILEIKETIEQSFNSGFLTIEEYEDLIEGEER